MRAGLSVGLVGVGLIALFSIFAVFGSFYTIDAGERGVVLRNGAIVGVADPGLHFKLPIVDSYAVISTRTQTMPYQAEPFYSRDQQAATADVSVTFAVQPDSVEQVYSQYGSVESLAQRVITPRIRKEFKEVMGQFNAAAAIQDRERMGVEVSKAITEGMPGLIIIESIQVENIDFSEAYESAIEQRMLSEVEIDKVRQNAEREKVQAEIAVTQAQAQADSRLALAKADADAIRLRGDAEAAAIDARGQALRDNPTLVDLVTAERWNGELPTSMPPAGTVPFLNVQ